MFSEEYDVSKVYSLSRRELLHTHARMWAVCTSVVSDSYENIFTPEATAKAQDILQFEFLDSGRSDSSSKTKFVEIYYNDSIEKIYVTTGMNMIHLYEENEWNNVLDKFDPNVNIREVVSNTFAAGINVNQIIVEGFILDGDGNTIGMQTNPQSIRNTESLLGKTIERLITQPQVVFIDWMKDGTITVHTRKDFNARHYTMPRDPNQTVMNLRRWEYKKTEYPKREVVENYTQRIVENYELVTDEDRSWMLSLLDHPEQEIDFSYVFTAEGDLTDVLVYKREASRFESWRPV